MQKTTHILTLAIAIISTLTLAVAVSYSDNQESREGPKIEQAYVVPQIIKSIDTNKPFFFAGEPVPVDNFDVRERLDRELTVNTYWHSSTILAIKSTTKYFPVMEKILAENGVPDDFKYLAVAESALRNAASPAGARGIWQFMKAIGQSYNLEINNEIDERFHLEKSTQAACQFLKDHKKQFGTWVLAAASYNMGATNLRNELRTQRTDSYYDLNLNDETMRYLFRIIAIKEILKDPRQFGFYLEEQDGYGPLNDYDVVEVNTAVENWGDFAAQYEVSYRLLKVYNPWLISSRLSNPARKSYEIKIPRKKL